MNKMLIKGINMVFAPDLVIDGEYIESDIYDDINEIAKIMDSLLDRLGENDHMELSIGQMINSKDDVMMDAFYLFYRKDMGTNWISLLTKYAEELVPDQEVCTAIPRKMLWDAGKKKEKLEDIVYTCRFCGCKYGICNSESLVKHYINDVTVNTECCKGEGTDEGIIMCPNCFDSIENCLCTYYPSHAFHVDKNIAPVITELNRKGYFTVASCESHRYDDQAYISFEVNYGVSVPEGWYIDKQFVMRFDFNEDESTYMSKKEMVMSDLLNWAKSLKQLDAFV